MKITVQINGIDTEIELTEGQVASIEAQSKPKQFEMKYVQGKEYYLGVGIISAMWFGDANVYLEHGRFRKTKESAELSLARNKRANRLEALVDQLDGMKEFVEGEYNYYIMFDYISDSYFWCSNNSHYCSERVYMTKECAIRVCEILNAGEYYLD